MDTRAVAGYAASWTTEGTSGEKTVTEAEWLMSKRADELQGYLGKADKRKMRLLACGCCRRLWSLISRDELRRVVEVAESFADGHSKKSALLRLFRLHAAKGADRVAMLVAAKHASIRTLQLSMSEARSVAANQLYASAYFDALFAESEMQAVLIRDVFANPFRPITLDPTWLAWNDATVVRLAQAAYDERHLPSGTLDNGRLAVLADALEEAGCTDTEILGHLRGPGPHVRGCWPVDMVLGKS